jgi:hypothetical protein
MKAAISYGLLTAMVVGVGFLGWQSRDSLGAAFRDDVLACRCGSDRVSFANIPKASDGSESLSYAATCENCGLRRQVVDVDWSDLRQVLDAWLSEQLHEAQLRSGKQSWNLESDEFLESTLESPSSRDPGGD